jgi:hypothetical protein
MREKINEMFEIVKNFEAYDWVIIICTAILVNILTQVLNTLYEFIMRKFFNLERNKYIKGWKRIK